MTMQDRWRYRLRDVHPHAMLSELSVESRQRHRWRSRGHEASLRRRRSRHHDHEQRAGAWVSPGTTITLHYSQLKAIADDVDDARVYGGIHWRFDQTGGNVLGRAVATAVVKNNLRPVHP